MPCSDRAGPVTTQAGQRQNPKENSSMAKAKIHCKEIAQKVTLLLNLWEDEYTGLDSLKTVKCNLQNTCEFFDAKTLCPSLRKVKKYYSNGR